VSARAKPDAEPSYGQLSLAQRFALASLITNATMPAEDNAKRRNKTYSTNAGALLPHQRTQTRPNRHYQRSRIESSLGSIARARGGLVGYR